MGRIALSTLGLIAVVAAVAGYVLTGTFLGSMPPLGFGWVTLLVVAVVDLGLALRIRRAVDEGTVGHDRSQVHPVSIARCAALGQASAILGAAAGGLGAGLSLHFGLQLGELAVANQEFPAALAITVSGVALLGAGLFLESSCRTPPEPDETGGLAVST